DVAAELIEDEGFVSAGGDIAVRGPVDVALPRGGAIRVVEGGLATSGVASRGRHLFDPRTGAPSDSPWQQVTASGASCLAADVAAKAAYLLGEDGPAWLDDRGIPGRSSRSTARSSPHRQCELVGQRRGERRDRSDSAEWLGDSSRSPRSCSLQRAAAAAAQ